MNILFTRFPLESADGGAEKQTISLMQSLRSRGHTVLFIGSCPVLLRYCDENGIPNIHVDIGQPPVTKFGAISFFWRQWRMKRILRNILRGFTELDAICMLSLTEKILLTPLAITRGLHVLWIEHDMVGRWLTQSPWLSKLRTLSADVVTVCVSTLSAGIFRDLGYSNVLAIPNGVSAPPGDFAPHTFDETLRIGCIARLSQEKGIDILAEVMRSVVNATALIVGKGNVHVPSSATITVKGDVRDINDVYSQIDVLVLPSRHEDPFGLVVAEAMMRGIAVICTDACGISGYLTNNVDALVIPAGDQKALHDAIDRMQDSTLRMQIANAGKHTAQTLFSLDTMVSSYEAALSLV